MHRLHRGDHADPGPSQLCQQPDVTDRIHGHLEYRDLMRFAETVQHGHRQTDLRVEISFALEHSLSGAEDVSGDFFSGGLAQAAGYADDVQARVLIERKPGHVGKRLLRGWHQDQRRSLGIRVERPDAVLRNVLYDRPRRALRQCLRDERMRIVLLALQRHKERARGNLARVDRDPREAELTPAAASLVASFASFASPASFAGVAALAWFTACAWFTARAGFAASASPFRGRFVGGRLPA